MIGFGFCVVLVLVGDGVVFLVLLLWFLVVGSWGFFVFVVFFVFDFVWFEIDCVVVFVGFV